jgi:hypothetical protein
MTACYDQGNESSGYIKGEGKSWISDATVYRLPGRAVLGRVSAGHRGTFPGSVLITSSGPSLL